MKILCTADLHIGRRSSRLPSGADERLFTAAAGFEDIVGLALSEEVGLLLLAGDLVDWENRFYEAYGPLERGVKRLVEAGIAVWAVAGNHDVEALPKLAEALGEGGFRLLGRSGSWERAVLEQNGRPLLAVDGWSFSARYETVPPLAGYSFEEPAVPRIVMLHGDLDQSKSRYAPVSRADMERIGADFWLLGHVHKPSLSHLPGEIPVLYPGSPLALDPGEAGEHGPWLLELDGRELKVLRHCPVSRMRYECVEMDVSALGDVDEFDTWMMSALSDHASRVLAGQPALRGLNLRVTLVGRTPLHRLLPERTARLAAEAQLEFDGVPVRLDRIDCNTMPACDLDALAEGATPVALLARLLLDLEQEATGGGSSQLLDDAGRRLAAVMSARPFQGLDDTTARLEQSEVLARLRHAGARLLDELLAQKEEP